MAGLLEAAMRRRQSEQLDGNLSQWRDPWEIAGEPHCIRCGGEVSADSTTQVCRTCGPKPHQPCRAEGCPRRAKHHGYCAKHWRKVQAGLDLDDADVTPADYARSREALIRKGVIGRRTTKNRESARRTHGEPPRTRAANEAARNEPAPRGQLDLFGPGSGRLAGRAA
jgi:hypothetical protein